MASETVPCGATIYSLPCASGAPVRQEGRPGRLPRTVTSLRRYLGSKRGAALDASVASAHAERAAFNEIRFRIANAAAALDVATMLLDELDGAR